MQSVPTASSCHFHRLAVISGAVYSTLSDIESVHCVFAEKCLAVMKRIDTNVRDGCDTRTLRGEQSRACKVSCSI